ncbi:hypothetical protein RZE82_07940 [Mollicutes bacterium LVI A0039]|nr:hypothetical protein RZE82_07940 [Mollicutes bacterium LVI A0039]
MKKNTGGNKKTGYKGKFYDPNYKLNKAKYGDLYNPKEFAIPNPNYEPKINNKIQNDNPEDNNYIGKSVIVKQEYMGYDLTVRCGFEKEKIQYRDEVETGFSWVGDQLVPSEFAGYNSEKAFVNGELIDETIVSISFLDSRMEFEEFDIIQLSFEEDLDDSELEKIVLNQMEPIILNLLCALIAADKGNEDNVVSEYLKIATKAGLNVGKTVIPHYEPIMAIYELSKEYEQYRNGNHYQFTNSY